MKVGEGSGSAAIVIPDPVVGQGVKDTVTFPGAHINGTMSVIGQPRRVNGAGPLML